VVATKTANRVLAATGRSNREAVISQIVHPQDRVVEVNKLVAIKTASKVRVATGEISQTGRAVKTAPRVLVETCLPDRQASNDKIKTPIITAGIKNNETLK
jgi:hypothetical protein